MMPRAPTSAAATTTRCNLPASGPPHRRADLINRRCKSVPGPRVLPFVPERGEAELRKCFKALLGSESSMTTLGRL
jgi:hypothetical protein